MKKKNIAHNGIPAIQVSTLLIFLIYMYPSCVIGQNDLHRSNLINSNLQNGLRYDGSNVKILIREEGFVNDHIDFKGRLENTFSRISTDNHQDLVSGCLGGSGNRNPLVQGMAPGVDIVIGRYFDNIAIIADSTLAFHKNKGVVIVNSSYADFGICNGGYNLHAHVIDKQLFDYPTLAHVFVAGNAGSSDCGYGVGSRFGNLEGGHLTAKNAISVGAVSAFSSLSSFSSKGPTMDGKLKPDLVAMGENYETTAPPNTYEIHSGTSYASPAVAGIMAQLYHAYKDLNQGINPPSALIKAAMCNTAEDLGNPGPDYSHGFGLVHAGRAYEVIKERQYMADSLPVLGNQSHGLYIPAGVSEARIMLYWPDKEAFPGATKALVNDLDISLTDTASNTFLPLVLDPTPILARLNAPAVPGIDTLNNIEQIVLENPQAGMYQIHVNGTVMPFGKVGYYLTYAFLKDELKVTFPLGGEGFRPQEDLIIRWDAYSDTGFYQVDYTLDNGRNWINIANNVPGALRYQMWQTPAQASGQARIRITRGTQSSESQANFTIMETPQNIQFARVCQDFVTLTWDAEAGATSYDIFLLGEKYMDSIGTTSNTFFEPKIRYQDENWFSVRGRGDSGMLSRRAIAVRQQAGMLVNCAGVAPTAAFAVDTALCDSQAVYLSDQSLKAPDTWHWTITPSIGLTFIDNTTDSSQHPVLNFDQSGTYQVKLKVASSFGVDSTSQTIVINPCNTSLVGGFEDVSLSLIPNPNEGLFALRMEGALATSYQLALMDLQGKVLHQDFFRTAGTQFSRSYDLSHLAGGLYLLRLSDGEKTVVLKVVIR